MVVCEDEGSCTLGPLKEGSVFLGSFNKAPDFLGNSHMSVSMVGANNIHHGSSDDFGHDWSGPCCVFK